MYKSKKYLAGLLIFIYTAVSFANTPERILPAEHWAYGAANDIFIESGKTALMQSAPLSVAEMQTYLDEIEYESLSQYGKAQYDRIQEYFKGEKTVISSGVISMGGNIIITPEIYARSNDNIDWSHSYYYKNRFITFPIFMSVTDYVHIETDLFAGRNYWAIHNKKYWNSPNAAGGAWDASWSDGRNSFFNLNLPNQFDSGIFDSIEFDWPRNAYISVGAPMNGKHFFNFTLGRGAMSIGQTQTGSILISDNFESDAYSKLSFFSPNIKYVLNVSQTDTNKYLYLHKFDFRVFKKLQISFIEGTYVNGPFEFRYLNPFMVIHSLSNWSRGLDDACAYMGFALDYVPIKNLRVYGLYAQTEARGPVERNFTTQPNGMGVQLGIETTVPMDKGAWKAGIEGVYTMPWLYIRPTPNSSMVTFKHTEHGARPDGDRDEITSWIGTPFGPDSIAGSVKFGYAVPEKWSAFISYLFLAQGENAFADILFYNKDGNRRSGGSGSDAYYPSSLANESEGERKANMSTPSGTAQFTNRIILEGSYYFNKQFSLSGKLGYAIISNRYNIKGNTQHGVEVAISGTYKIF